ncbi:hypothetical protein NLI96_g6984 [Meripilus lineatus]|uniref:Pentatricopeptide repeat-containing protein n=1 Tax=Meripilus lineatus TaxID=2056292 RepID=A0AAD5YHM1_9APHY|nr:hypothetical protein NLI96_g6984 [Physisporinus lineatus]
MLISNPSVVQLRDAQKKLVHSALNTLAISGKPPDLRLIDEVLLTMESRWTFPVSLEAHDVIISGLLETAEDNTVVRWLLNMPDKPGAHRPTAEQWNPFLLRCQTERNIRTLKSSFSRMRSSGCKPTETTYMILIRGLFHSQVPLPTIIAVRQLIADMKEDKIDFTDAMRDIMVAAYLAARSPDRAIQVETLHSERLNDSNPVDLENATRAKKLAYAASQPRTGHTKAKALLRKFRGDGFVPSTATLALVLKEAKSEKDLISWEDILDVKANGYCFARVIRNAEQEGDRYACLRLLRLAREERKLPWTVEMVHPTLRALCSARSGTILDTGIKESLDILREYVQQRDEHSPEPSADLPLYNTVIRTLASSTSEKYFSQAVSLIEEMRARGVAMDSLTSCSMITVLIKMSSTVTEAFDAYNIAYQDNQGKLLLDRNGFVMVLNAFCKRTIPTGEVDVAIQLYFRIVKDMRMAGFPVPIEVYTIILRSINERILSVKKDPEATDALAKAIRRIHDMINVDGSLVPDAILWNELMNSYQRAGCYGEAMDVWQAMYLSGKFDPASVSIVLDLCGFSQDDAAALRVFQQLLDVGFKLNQRNWNNWIECLCRLGKLDEALKVFCLESDDSGLGAGPSVDSFKVLFQFAARTNEQGLVRSRVKRYLPKLWEKLPESLRGMS